MTARLYEKRGTWHIVLIYTNQQGKRAQKWINTGLAIKGNSRRAKQMMARAITEWGPVLEDTGRPATEAMQSLPLPRRNKVGFDSPSGILFADYLTTWLEDRKNKLAITTYGGYQQEIDRIARYFRQHNLYIEQIDEMVITNFYRYNRRQGLSENTLLHYQTIMNQTLRKAVKEKLIPLNPYAVIDKDVKPSHTRFVPETYDVADLERLFTAMQGDPLALFILMDVTYGLRRSELLGLKWSAIDFDNKNIHIGFKVTEAVVNGKTQCVMNSVMKNKSSNRTLPLVPIIEKELLQRREEQMQNQKLYRKSYDTNYLDFVFVNDMGTLFKPDYITRHFRELLQKNNLKVIRVHDLRHTCATMLCRQKISLRDIQLWLGHSTYQTTADIYTHLDYRDKLNTANAAADMVLNIMHKNT